MLTHATEKFIHLSESLFIGILHNVKIKMKNSEIFFKVWKIFTPISEWGIVDFFQTYPSLE